MVHRRPTSYLMYAVLVFQLAVGMNWPVAHAATVPQQGQTGGMEMAHCPEHASLGLGGEGPDTHNGQVEGSADHDPSHHQQLQAKHDCCRSAGCQCHCAFTPCVTGPMGLRIFVSFGYLVPILDARVTTARHDEFFRPPIA
jgi:hypothetical protein